MASPFRWIDDGLTTIGQAARKVPGLRRMLTGHWSLRLVAYLIPLLLAVGMLWLVWDGYQRIKFGRARIALVELGIKTDPPTRESRYCRRLFGYGQEYPACYAAERAGYAQFARAWEMGKDLGTLRDQMIGCYLEGRRTEGTSWAAASHCAEADAPGAGTVQ